MRDVVTFEELSRDECLELLHKATVGRIGGFVDGRPFIVPVNFAVDQDRVVFKTSPGTKLSASAFSRVAFEIDSFDPTGHTGWSVVIEGVASDISDMIDERSTKLRALDLQPWPPGERTHWVAILPESITGRRLRPVIAKLNGPR